MWDEELEKRAAEMKAPNESRMARKQRGDVAESVRTVLQN